jgi:hypothetical protein
MPQFDQDFFFSLKALFFEVTVSKPVLAHIVAFPNKCTIKLPFHTTATEKV